MKQQGKPIDYLRTREPGSINGINLQQNLKQLTPSVALGLGSATEKSKNDTASYGSFINPSAGIWYRLSKNTALFAGIAYEMIEMDYARPVDNIPFRRKNNTLSVNIGIIF